MIKHTIRKNGEGGMKDVRLTKAKAIRYHCVECMGFSYQEIDGCTSPNCALFPYRHGGKPIGYEVITRENSENYTECGEEQKS